VPSDDAPTGASDDTYRGIRPALAYYPGKM